nr:hypothetical protein [Tanacetum cinerariifolium]
INEEHGLISLVQKLRRTNHKDFQNCLFACHLSQMEPKKQVQALKDPSWVEPMNKKDERGIVVKNKARLVAQGHTQGEGIYYDELFTPVARIEAIRLFLAYASFNDFVVYQMDVKSAFLYGKIEEEVYVCQPPGFEDPDFPDKVYKVEKALYGLHQALRACQDKYVADILKKIDFSTVKTASTPIEPNKALIKDAEAEDVDVYLYRSMIGSLMYLTASRPDITSAVCAMNDASSVRRSMNIDSHDKNSVLANSKNSAKKVAVYVRKNKQTDNTFVNVISNKENVIDVDVANASKAKNLLCVSYTTYGVLKTRFSKQPTQSKTLDTTFVVSKSKIDVVHIILWIVDSGCSKHMTGDRSLLRNFIEKFMSTVRFGNDNFAAITGYGDYIQDNITICHVYYVEGLGHNLFSVGQFCDGGHESNLYTIFISDMAASSSVFLMSKATSTKSWGKRKKASHLLKLVSSDNSKLELLHMDLCGPMRVASINGKKYILVIVDDYSRFTWVYFLHSKDETLEIIKKFIAQAHLNYKAKVYKIRTDNGTEFKNATLKAHYEKLGIMQQFLTARTPQQNGVVERRNRTLIEPNVEYFHVFGSLCYPTNDRDDLGKMKPKADIRVFIGYSKTSRGFRIYNQRTKKIMETIHVKFDELTAMACEHDCLEPELQRFNNINSSAEPMITPSKEDLDHLFGPMFEEYFDPSWIESMQDELNQFERLYVWELIPRPEGKNIFALKWLWKNKCDAENIVVRNKTRLVAKGYRREEGIDFEESFAPVARLEAVRILPKGFIDPEFPNHVYRLKKALYGLKQAPRVWYDKLSSFLIEHGFTKGIVDPTLFTRRHEGDILLVQVYVDDIIFGSTNPDFSKRFANLMKNNFEMSMMGKLKFFLGLQVHQLPCVIWMRTQLLDYGYKYNRILMYCDSKSVIAISCNLVQHSKTKHIDIRYHFIKEHVEKGTVELYFVGTEYQLADLFTKALPKECFEYLVHRIGYKSFFQELQGRYGYFFEHLRAKFMPRKSFATLADHFHEAMADSLPTMVNKHIKEQVEKQVPEHVRNQVLVYVAEGTLSVCPRDQDDPHDDAHPKGEKSAKRQKTSEYETYVSRESSSGHDNEHEQGLSTSVVFNDDDIEERTSRWVNKCVNKFNPYARYGVEHWKNTHAKIFYIRKQKEPGKPKEIIARRANDCIMSITEPDFKNLNKNDIEDMYLLTMNGKVPDNAETGLLWSL